MTSQVWRRHVNYSIENGRCSSVCHRGIAHPVVLILNRFKVTDWKILSVEAGTLCCRRSIKQISRKQLSFYWRAKIKSGCHICHWMFLFLSPSPFPSQPSKKKETHLKLRFSLGHWKYLPCCIVLQYSSTFLGFQLNVSKPGIYELVFHKKCFIKLIHTIQIFLFKFHELTPYNLHFVQLHRGGYSSMQ
jgi:hypothetical protein